MDPKELYAIKQAIKENEQKKAAAEKRLERFCRDVEALKVSGEQCLEAFGISCLEEPAKIVKSQKFHPESVALFQQFLEEHGQKPPGFMKDLQPVKEKEEAPPPEPGDKSTKKRLKFHL